MSIAATIGSPTTAIVSVNIRPASAAIAIRRREGATKRVLAGAAALRASDWARPGEGGRALSVKRIGHCGAARRADVAVRVTADGDPGAIGIRPTRGIIALAGPGLARPVPIDLDAALDSDMRVFLPVRHATRERRYGQDVGAGRLS